MKGEEERRKRVKNLARVMKVRVVENAQEDGGLHNTREELEKKRGKQGKEER